MLSSVSGGRSWAQALFRRCASIYGDGWCALCVEVGFCSALCTIMQHGISRLKLLASMLTIAQARRRRRFEDAQDVKKRKAKEISQRNSKA